MITRNCVFLLVAVFVLSHSAFAQSTYNQFPVDSIIPNTITVTAEGTAEAEPDVSKFSFDIETVSSKLGRSRTYNMDKTQKVIDFLTKAGINQKDIKTVSFTIGQAGNDYRTTNKLKVTLRSVEKIDEVLEGIIKLGISNLSAVKYEVEDSEGLKNKAYEDAVKIAYERAKVLANTAGVSLGKVQSIVETPVYSMSGQMMYQIPVQFQLKPEIVGMGSLSPSGGGSALSGTVPSGTVSVSGNVGNAQPSYLSQFEDYKVTVKLLVTYSIEK